MKPTQAPCPSDLQLDAYFAEELNTKDHTALSDHIAGCERCQLAIAQRRQGFAAFGGTDQAYLARFRNRITGHENARASQRRPESSQNKSGSWWQGWRAAGFALVTAAVAVIVVVTPREPNQSKPNPKLEPSTPKVRTKGGSQLEIFVSRDQAVERVSDDAKLREGDKLRFRVSLAQEQEVLLLGQEEDGQLYPIATSPKQASITMQAGIHQDLQQAIELDGSLGQEAVHFIACSDPFQFDDVQFSEREIISPKNCTVSTISFEKVPRTTP